MNFDPIIHPTSQRPMNAKLGFFISDHCRFISVLLTLFCLASLAGTASVGQLARTVSGNLPMPALSFEKIVLLVSPEQLRTHDAYLRYHQGTTAVTSMKLLRACSVKLVPTQSGTRLHSDVRNDSHGCTVTGPLRGTVEIDGITAFVFTTDSVSLEYVPK